MIKIGQEVFEAGSWCESTKRITVSDDNMDRVNKFWNKLFFDNQEDADRIMHSSKADYGAWLYSNY